MLKYTYINFHKWEGYDLMAGYRDFEDKPINKTLSYIHWFFISSIYFFICNIIFVLSLFLFDIKLNNMVIFFIAVIPAGPSLTALFYFTNKLVYDKYVDTTRDFIKGYKKNALLSLKFWMIFLIILFVGIFDLKLCFSNGNFLFLIIPLSIILIFSICICSYALPIISKYEIKIFDVFKLSFYLSFKKPLNTFVNIIIISFFLYFIFYSPGIMSIFISSISCYLIQHNLKSSYLFIDNKYLK